MYEFALKAAGALELLAGMLVFFLGGILLMGAVDCYLLMFGVVLIGFSFFFVGDGEERFRKGAKHADF